MKKGQKYILFVGSEKVEAFPHAVYTVNNYGLSGALPKSSKVLEAAKRLAKQVQGGHATL